MGLKEIFSSLKSASSTSASSMSTQKSNASSKRNNNVTNSMSKKNRYDLQNYSLDNDLLDTNCILINKTNLSPQQQQQQAYNFTASPTATSPSPQFVQLAPSSTLTRRESTRSNTSTTNNNEPTRFLIENHAKHVSSILNTNSQTIEKLTKYRNNVDTLNNKPSKMITSPSCDVALLANSISSPRVKHDDSSIKTPESSKTFSVQPRTRIKTNPWIRSPSFNTTPIQTAHHIRSQTNEDIFTLSGEPKRFSKFNLSFNAKIDEAPSCTVVTSSLCKKCSSLKCSCLQNSKDSGISSIISNTGTSNNIQQLSPFSLRPVLSQLSPHTTFDSIITSKTNTSSSSSSISSLNNKNSSDTRLSPKHQIFSNSLDQQRTNDDYSILFEEALESSSSSDHYKSCNSGNKTLNDSYDCKTYFKRNASYRYSLDQNLITRKSLTNEPNLVPFDNSTANFVAEVTNLFDKALLELPDFSMPSNAKQQENPVNKSRNVDDEDDIELENSVNELYKQIEILKEQKKMLDEKMKIAKLETAGDSIILKYNNSDICKIVKEIRL